MKAILIGLGLTAAVGFLAQWTGYLGAFLIVGLALELSIYGGSKE